MNGKELMQFFTWAHLPPHLQEVSRVFAGVAGEVDACPDWVCELHIGDALGGLLAYVEALPDNSERAECARKLRAAKSFVRGYGTAAGGMSKGGCLRLLLEAKDCAVRAVIFKAPEAKEG